MKRWREVSRKLFDLETGVERCDAIYRELVAKHVH